LFAFITSRRSLLALASLALAAQISTATAGPSQTQVGEAASPCTAWTLARQQSKPSVRKAAMSSWVLGFISGINVDTPEVDFLADANPETVWSSIDKYCREYTNRTLGEAVSELAMSLYRDKSLPTKRDEVSFRRIRPAVRSN
jgi:hypothetical protein